jgi:hypothetical protein
MKFTCFWTRIAHVFKARFVCELHLIGSSSHKPKVVASEECLPKIDTIILMNIFIIKITHKFIGVVTCNVVTFDVVRV